MALNTMVNNFTDGTFVMKDAAGTPISATVQYHNGDLSISGLAQQLNEVAAYEARGILTSVRHTTRTYPTVSFTAQMTGFTNATAGLGLDAVMKAGAFSSGVSTLGAAADVWATTMVWTVEGTDFGGADSTCTCTNVHWTADVSESDPNSISFSGTVYGTVTLA